MGNDTGEITGQQVWAAWTEHGNNKSAAARALGIPRSTFRHIFDQHRAELMSTMDLANASVQGQGPKRLAHTNAESAWAAAADKFDAEKARDIQRKSQTLRIEPARPIMLAWVADLHAGAVGTDYGRALEDAHIISETPNMFAGFVGDGINNFIVGRLAKLAFFSSYTIPEEWMLFGHYLKVLAPKLRIVCGGNHDWWTTAVAGIPFFEELVASIVPDCLYDSDEIKFTLELGGWQWEHRVRHKWRYTSIHNPTHGIERSAERDHDFVVGVGAHTHRGAFARQFATAGHDCLAVQVGTYKKIDHFARQHGFPRQGPGASVAVLFDPDTGSMTGFNDLNTAARVMEGL